VFIVAPFVVLTVRSHRRLVEYATFANLTRKELEKTSSTYWLTCDRWASSVSS